MSDYRISDSGRILPGGMENEIHRLPMRLAGAALLIMAVIGWVSLMTWSIGDPSLNRATEGEPNNLLGGAGASLADMLLQVLGLTSIALFFPPAIWGLTLALGERVQDPRRRLVMWSFSLVLVASALSIVPEPKGWYLVHGLGGIIGDFGKTLFTGVAGLLHERLAAPLGGAVAGVLGFMTLMRAIGIDRHDFGMLLQSDPERAPGRGFIGLLGAGMAHTVFAFRSLGRGIGSTFERDRSPSRNRMPAYWEPEDAERFTPTRNRRGSFNPRYGGFDLPPQPERERFPAVHRHEPQPSIAAPQDDERIEPYFDTLRAIPRQQPRQTQQAPQPAPQPQMAPPQQQWPQQPVPQPQQPQYQPQQSFQPQMQPPMPHTQPPQQNPQPQPPQPQPGMMQPPQVEPQLYVQPQQPVQQQIQQPYYQHPPQQPQQPAPMPQGYVQPQAAAYPSQPAHYANENNDASAYGQVQQTAPGQHVAQDHGQTPQAQIVRGGHGPAVAMQPPMPDRTAPNGHGRVAPQQGQDWPLEDFALPALDLLTPAPPRQSHPDMSDSALGRRAEMLQSVLEDFRVKGQITGVHPGPVITLYEFEPARGTKSSRVIGLADDIARSMSAVSARVAVIPGRDAIGIELPNQNREVVYLRELLEAKEFDDGKGRLQLALGKTIGGDPVVVDLARMPHLLIAGTTGSGKSVAINTMILSLLYRMSPEDCRFLMIDPKMLELSVYDGIPHLLTPVVTDPHQAIKALKWTVAEMNSRYERMCKLGVRNIMGFNQKVARAKRTGEPLARTVQTGFDEDTGEAIYEREPIDPTPMPYIVVVIDEMADLMMVAGKDIEFAVQRLSQMARAAGIHLIMATQRPSVDVITGTIKANFPSRISFQVTSKIDSRTILGEQGAEQLLGAGDMLTMAAGGRIMRAHGPFVSDDEVEDIVNYLRAQGEPDYTYGVLDDEPGSSDSGGNSGGDNANGYSGSGDEVYDQAIEVVLRDRRPTTSYLQRRLGIGYNRAASLIERMEADGVISAPNRTGKREVLAPEQS